MPTYTAPPTLEDLLLTFRRQIIEGCRKEGLPYNLTLSQIEIVKYVGLEGSKTMRSIAEHLKITPPSTTKMINELEHKGVIVRSSDAFDRRSITVSLTKKAKDIHRSMQRHKATVLQKMLQRLNAEEQKKLERIVTKLITD